MNLAQAVKLALTMLARIAPRPSPRAGRRFAAGARARRIFISPF
jgi:hypothetical protein